MSIQPKSLTESGPVSPLSAEAIIEAVHKPSFGAPTFAMQTLLEATNQNSPNIAPMSEADVMRHITQLGPHESMQLADYTKCDVGHVRTAQEQIAAANFYLIGRTVQQIRREDPGWGSLDRITGQGPHARRRTMGRDETREGGIGENVKTPDPLLP